MLTLIHGFSSIDLLSLNCEVFDEPHLEPSLCKINTESPIYNPTFNQVNIGVEGRGSINGSNGEKWTAPELDDRSKVDGLLKNSGRSRGKIDGPSTENGHFVKKWVVLG